MAEEFKSTYLDAIVLSLMLLSIGGCIAFSLFIANKSIIALIILLFIAYQSNYFFRSTYEYNNSIDEKKHLFVTNNSLNEQQKHWFLTKMDEEITKPKKPAFWDQAAAHAIYLYLTDKIVHHKPLTENEQYVLNLFLIDYLDLDQIARNWIILN